MPAAAVAVPVFVSAAIPASILVFPTVPLQTTMPAVCAIIMLPMAAASVFIFLIPMALHSHMSQLHACSLKAQPCAMKQLHVCRVRHVLGVESAWSADSELVFALIQAAGTAATRLGP